MAQEHIPLEDMSPRNYESLHSELARVLNQYGVDALLSTPDHVLATLVIKNLDNYGEAIADRKRLAMRTFDRAVESVILPGEVIQEADVIDQKTWDRLGSHDAIMTDKEKFKKLAGDTGVTDSMVTAIQTIAQSMATTADTFGRANEDQVMRDIEMRIPEYNKLLPKMPGQ